MQINYLVVRLTSTNRVDAEIKHQLMKAERIAGCMNNIIRNYKYLTHEAKSRVYKSAIHPVTSNASETKQQYSNNSKKMRKYSNDYYEGYWEIQGKIGCHTIV